MESFCQKHQSEVYTILNRLSFFKCTYTNKFRNSSVKAYNFIYLLIDFAEVSIWFWISAVISKFNSLKRFKFSFVSWKVEFSLETLFIELKNQQLHIYSSNKMNDSYK